MLTLLIKTTTNASVRRGRLQTKKMSLLVLSILLGSVVTLSTSENATEFEGLELVQRAITEYLETGEQPHNFLPTIKAFESHYGLKEIFIKFGCTRFPIMCPFCEKIVSIIKFFYHGSQVTREVIAFIFEAFCIFIIGYSPRMCSGLVELNLDIFLHVLDTRPDITSAQICGTLFQRCGCSRGAIEDWSIEIPPGTSLARTFPNSPSATFNILHLSDIHYDPNYTPGGNAVCHEPMCCQHDQQEPNIDSRRCGYWSDYKDADSPWHLVEETVRQVKTQTFDYVYYTGDIISHRVWDTSIESNTRAIRQVFDYFGHSFGVPVYPVFGNHEPHPLNIWPTASVTNATFSVQWLFELAAESWPHLVGEDVRETVLKGGYYTVSPRPGFRIVAINSNMYYAFNIWAIFNDPDPYDQLQWLAETLAEAERNGESVHILSHVPTGSPDSLSVWGRQYARIVERFSNTITGQFCGHTHEDGFYVYYNQNGKPVGVAFDGASVTPYQLANPSYKIFQVDSTTFSLQDFEEWTFNLAAANANFQQRPEWYKLYSFVEAYGIENLTPVEVAKVPYKMVQNNSLILDFHRFKFRDSEVRGPCGESCQRDYLCDITTTVWDQTDQCRFFQLRFDLPPLWLSRGEL